MPFNCDVCGEEVSYEEPTFKLRNNAEIVICKECIKKGMDKEDDEPIKEDDTLVPILIGKIIALNRKIQQHLQKIEEYMKR